MRREDFVNLFERLPIEEHARTQIVMRANVNISVDTLIRLEEAYAVIRGREAGNQDEGRAFFVPYDEVSCIKLERVVQSVELERWFSDRPTIQRQDGAGSAPLAETPPPPPEALDPAVIARQNLLERIRAARSVIKK
jgi:hypothetical protein